MPSQAPASFALAAASTNPSDASSHNRSGGGSGDWSRRPNGTQTFRRPSQLNTNSLTKETSQQATATPTSGVYVPPHLNSSYQSSLSRPTAVGDFRYSKEQMLEFFKSRDESRMSNGILQDSLTEGWVPGSQSTTIRDWGRKDESRDSQHNPEICWDLEGSVQPLGLVEMEDDEKELFSTSVNSPLKGPTQGVGKDGLPTPGVNGRKSSISQGQGPGASNLQSGRPGPRRRETSDSITGNSLGTPSFSRQLRDDAPLVTPPSSLLRRRTDFKEGASGSPFEKGRLDTGIDTSSPFNSWKRNASGPMSAGITGPSSPWAPSGPQSAGFGAFGNFSLDGPSGTPSTPGEKRLGFGSLRGESRFKGLMGKDSSEDMAAKSKEKPFASLEKLSESETERQVRKSSQEPDNLDEGERIGSAALGGDEPSPPPRSYLNSVDAKKAQDDIVFSSFNSSAGLGGARDNVARKDDPPQNLPPTQLTHELMSPTDTNPYQSPDATAAMDSIDTEDDSHPTSFSYRHSKSANPNSAFESSTDRSQPSSGGQQKGFPPLGGLGGLGTLGGSGPWSAAPGGFSQRGQAFGGGAFGDSLFGSMADLSSAGGAFGTPTTSTFGTGRSKMGSLFSSQIPETTKSETSNGNLYNDLFTQRGGFDVGSAPSSNALEGQGGTRALDDLFATNDTRRGIESVSSPFSDGLTRIPSQAPSALATTTANTIVDSENTISAYGRSPEPDNANQPPPAQQRQMVMPDRMRWIYRDPSGNTQGPFSGLEMHDWYKAGFFSPELQVKKLEDTDYEPLAQLIRRIGNSREPFLVPQIGIPHGPGSGPSVLGNTGTPQNPGAQPPFGNSFPSFGTTLTADQQNALERRKQEEQYLMARQKEHLAQHQVYLKQMQMSMPVHPQQLHHHSSAHSLQSQPSYGSITSPGGFQISPSQVPGAPSAAGTGIFDSPMRQGFGAHGFDGAPLTRDANLPSTMDRLNLGGPSPFGQNSFGGMPHQQDTFSHQQQVSNMLQDRARLQAQQDQFDAVPRNSERMERDTLERLQQFNQLQTHEADQARPPSGPIARPTAQEVTEKNQPAEQHFVSQPVRQPSPKPATVESYLFEQIQSTVEDVALARGVDGSTVPQPSTSPLPAPAAQRNRQHIAEVLAAESGSRSPTPAVETPTATLAPWAKENADGQKGPSLKEIQEIEARKRAQQQEAATAVRRQLAEQERIAAAQAASEAPAAGLPSSASWAANSPTANATASPWVKPAAGKIATPTATSKKSLAQIQKEEEAKKSRVAAAAAANASAVVTTSVPGGKSYANLAGKVTSPINTGAGGAWTTVGAGGKAKAPASPSIPAPTRTVGVGATTTVAPPKSKPAPTARSITGGSAVQNAHDDFQKWAKNSLVKGLNTGINVEDFVRNLFQLPREAEIISEAIYGSSITLDGHRFAEEFIRRSKQADKGIPPETTASSNFQSGGGDSNSKNSSGGWNEVAKKAPNAPKEEGREAFKVVAAKKKGKR